MSFKRSRATFDDAYNADPPSHAPFVIYGTPLPAYDLNARDDGTYVPLRKQEVRDEQGRKRLHGAFTGGWSAGYFNTVGSKEGWTPASFVSSRGDRKAHQDGASSKRQKIEDYMDEEDLADLAESQRLMTKDHFSGLGSDAGGEMGSGLPLADIFRSTAETMGTALLQKMGWKPGQGIGARVQRQADGDKYGQLHRFAPTNASIQAFLKKSDRRGLACAAAPSLNRDSISSSEDESIHIRKVRSLQSSRPQGRLGSASRKTAGINITSFGASDEEDSYALGPRIKHNRTVGVPKKKKLARSIQSDSSALVTRNTKRVQVCQDGQRPLQGFILAASNAAQSANLYTPPKIPAGWRSSKAQQPSTEAEAQLISVAEAARASNLEPRSRAEILGEVQLPGKSIFDFLSSRARDRIISATGKDDLPAARGEKAPPGYEVNNTANQQTLWTLVPELSKEIASAAIQRIEEGWLPYSDDASKQTRYQKFLELRKGLHSDLPERSTNQSVNDWASELREFAQAAEVFKPVSASIASRFATSSTQTNSTSEKAHSGSTQTDPLDAAEKAAKMGFFGPLTRTSQNFYPTRLICKRFGVRQPDSVAEHEEHSVRPNDRKAEPHAIELGQSMTTSINRPSQALSESSVPLVDRQGKKLPGDEIGPSNIPDWESNAALEEKRAGEAVFKAIFGSDSEDES